MLAGAPIAAAVGVAPGPSKKRQRLFMEAWICECGYATLSEGYHGGVPERAVWCTNPECKHFQVRIKPPMVEVDPL
jgi:hypothetical protein